MDVKKRQNLIDQYAAGYSEVAAALVGFPSEVLIKRFFPGKWSAAEIVQHLADSEMNSALRLRKLLAEDFPVIFGYDQERYAQSLFYNEREIEPALDAFRGARASSMQLLRRMSEADWLREGWHTEHGRYTPETWLEIYAVHAHNHAEQIRRLRDALLP